MRVPIKMGVVDRSALTTLILDLVTTNAAVMQVTIWILMGRTVAVRYM